MRIGSFNINSLRVRLDPLLDWLEREDLDVLCLQETKLPDPEFPEDAFGDLSYDVCHYGQPAYNGVAIASRGEQREVARGLPGFDEPDQRRLVAATIEGIRIVNVYCPNGTALGTDKFDYKLRWFAALAEWLAPLAARDTLVCGDFNVAPSDRDVFDPRAFVGQTHVSPAERAAFERLLGLGFVDAFRHLHPEERAFTWWDYRGVAFARDEGMRIDHFLVSPSLLPRLRGVTIDVAVRRGEQPSDHAPLILELA